MAYVLVPKDLTRVKTKVAFNLTKRQLVCFGCGAHRRAAFLFAPGPAGNSVAAMCMMLVMLPFFMLAMYENTASPGKDHRQHPQGGRHPAQAAPLPHPTSMPC
ncbi:MAG: PrgI family protein [Faecalibacterium prausnitzii]